MISDFLTKAEAGNPVYISNVYKSFQGLADKDSQTLNCILTLLEKDELRSFPIKIPKFQGMTKQDNFIKEYVWAEIYNILSSLGGKKMDVYVDLDNKQLVQFVRNLNNTFDIDKKRSDRRGYGRAVNVIDRMLNTLAPDVNGFSFKVDSIENIPEIKKIEEKKQQNLDVYHNVTQNMDGKLLCGIDVGGTDIKIALVKDGDIDCYKEYDWFPARFTTSLQLVDPICLIVRLMRAKASLDVAPDSSTKEILNIKMVKALDIAAKEDFMIEFCDEVEEFLQEDMVEIDGVGMCFPDVVVRNKVVGGEVYKTRGIRNNSNINYEEDFSKLTNLNDRIQELIKKDGNVFIINDGPMASFTAAVEIAASDSPHLIKNGVFAHTLGTELGTGWVDEEGNIPDIPLEVYNFIIDLGSYVEKSYVPDDLRSINNFNTELPGTLQKYTSQSGVFRLAMKYFPKEKPELFQELIEKEFVVKKTVYGITGYYVPTEPKDQRKPFLEHMMSLPEREADELNDRIWKEIGEFLAVTWIETKKILNPTADPRVLFGRLVKRKRCYDLMWEGAKSIKNDIQFEVADSTLANTPLMKQLENDPHFTVAQFAQAVGAAYYANK
ncbi:MAG: hypothetical protein OCD02_13775 [Spirochaetaceae bacterium]